MRKANVAKAPEGAFDVVFGFDMETDVGSFTPYYEGVKHGTPELLKLLKKHGIAATFFWTGHAAENNAETVRLVRDAGHETGCHGLYHETQATPFFRCPTTGRSCPSRSKGACARRRGFVRKVSGVKPTSFRCPRLWAARRWSRSGGAGVSRRRYVPALFLRQAVYAVITLLPKTGRSPQDAESSRSPTSAT
jgi:peptidoglycan/xylan/chitin deacetylase (PgdA/CDA1 family)